MRINNIKFNLLENVSETYYNKFLDNLANDILNNADKSIRLDIDEKHKRELTIQMAEVTLDRLLIDWDNHNSILDNHNIRTNELFQEYMNSVLHERFPSLLSKIMIKEMSRDNNLLYHSINVKYMPLLKNKHHDNLEKKLELNLDNFKFLFNNIKENKFRNLLSIGYLQNLVDTLDDAIKHNILGELEKYDVLEDLKESLPEVFTMENIKKSFFTNELKSYKNGSFVLFSMQLTTYERYKFVNELKTIDFEVILKSLNVDFPDLYEKSFSLSLNGEKKNFDLKTINVNLLSKLVNELKNETDEDKQRLLNINLNSRLKGLPFINFKEVEMKEEMVLKDLTESEFLDLIEESIENNFGR